MVERIKRLAIWIEREEMLLKKPKSVTPIKEISGVCIHHTNTKMKKINIGYEIRKVRALQQYHMELNKWSDISFNYLVGQTGNIYEGRGLDIRPASQSTKAGNDHYLSIAWLGNYHTMNPTEEALEGINLLIEDLESIYDMDFEIKTHRDFKKVDCPGERITTWIKKGRKVKNAKYKYNEVLEDISKVGYYIDE